MTGSSRASLQPARTAFAVAAVVAVLGGCSTRSGGASADAGSPATSPVAQSGAAELDNDVCAKGRREHDEAAIRACWASPERQWRIPLLHEIGEHDLVGLLDLVDQAISGSDLALAVEGANALLWMVQSNDASVRERVRELKEPLLLPRLTELSCETDARRACGLIGLVLAYLEDPAGLEPSLRYAAGEGFAAYRPDLLAYLVANNPAFLERITELADGAPPELLERIREVARLVVRDDPDVPQAIRALAGTGEAPAPSSGDAGGDDGAAEDARPTDAGTDDAEGLRRRVADGRFEIVVRGSTLDVFERTEPYHSFTFENPIEAVHINPRLPLLFVAYFAGNHLRMDVVDLPGRRSVRVPVRPESHGEGMIYALPEQSPWSTDGTYVAVPDDSPYDPIRIVRSDALVAFLNGNAEPVTTVRVPDGIYDPVNDGDAQLGLHHWISDHEFVFWHACCGHDRCSRYDVVRGRVVGPPSECPPQ